MNNKELVEYSPIGKIVKIEGKIYKVVGHAVNGGVFLIPWELKPGEKARDDIQRKGASRLDESAEHMGKEDPASKHKRNT